MTRLLIWRHGRTAWNVAGRTQGHTDIELDDVGRAQARAAARSLAAERPDAIISSDLRRATGTADALAALTGLPVGTDPRLRERYYGPWEGLTRQEIRARYPAGYHGSLTLATGTDHIETLPELGKRAAEAMLAAADTTPDGTTVIVTHGGTARCGTATLLGWTDEMLPTLGPLHNGHWTELHRRPSGWILHTHNAVVH